MVLNFANQYSPNIRLFLIQF